VAFISSNRNMRDSTKSKPTPDKFQFFICNENDVTVTFFKKTSNGNDVIVSIFREGK
jgi:transcription elongation factor Elf1